MLGGQCVARGGYVSLKGHELAGRECVRYKGAVSGRRVMCQLAGHIVRQAVYELIVMYSINPAGGE